MKGCARTCILSLLGWAAFSYAFYFHFIRIRDFGSPMYWASIIAGLSVTLVITYALGIGTTYGERKTLLDAMAGTPPADGKWAAISGTIHSMGPLTAPISTKDSVAYEYRIHRTEGSGKSSRDVTYYEGKALAPSTISTRNGSVRLLAVPSLAEIPEEEVPWQQAVENAKTYVAQTAFEMRETSKDRRQGVEAEWTDDDGQYRTDRRFMEADVDLADDFRFIERRIPQGAQVCAFGLFSRERGGLIPHQNWAKGARIVLGDPMTVASKLRSRMIKYVIGIVVCSGIAYGIVRFYEYKAATLP
jgi:hypothetical protein